jgi:hypothetical protein
MESKTDPDFTATVMNTSLAGTSLTGEQFGWYTCMPSTFPAKAVIEHVPTGKLRWVGYILTESTYAELVSVLLPELKSTRFNTKCLQEHFHATIAYGVRVNDLKELPKRITFMIDRILVTNDGGLAVAELMLDNATRKSLSDNGVVVDGKKFHLTLGADCTKGFKPFHSNNVLELNQPTHLMARLQGAPDGRA